MWRILTQIIGNFECAVCKQPEKDSFSRAHSLASSVHPGSNEYTTSHDSLHEDITCNRQVLPGQQQSAVTTEAYNDTSQTSATISSPLIVSYDANGLVSISDPCHRSLSYHLSQGEEVRSRVSQVHEVFKHSSLVCKVWSLRERGVSYRRTHTDI